MMKPPRRDTLKIISDLLINMQEPRRITHLLYLSNLSYAQLIKYVRMVVQMGLAKEQEKPFHCYSLTQEGEFFIKMVGNRLIKKENMTEITIREKMPENKKEKE